MLPPWCQDDGHLEAWRNGREVPGFGDAVLVLVDGAGWIVMGDVLKISSIYIYIYMNIWDRFFLQIDRDRRDILRIGRYE